MSNQNDPHADPSQPWPAAEVSRPASADVPEPASADVPPPPPAPHGASTAYPDPALAAPFPTSPVQGSEIQSGRAGGGAPAYTSPSAFAGPGQPQSPGAPGIAIAALVVSILAFLTGWILFVGLVIGLVGLVLGIIAMRQRGGRLLSIIAIVASGLAVLTGLGVLAFTGLLLAGT